MQALAADGPGCGERLTESGEAREVGEQDDTVEVLGHRQTAIQTGRQRPEAREWNGSEVPTGISWAGRPRRGGESDI